MGQPPPGRESFLPSLPIFTVPGDPTLSGHDKAGHAVRHTGSSSQEGDPHDDIRDPQGVTDDGDLGGSRKRQWAKRHFELPAQVPSDKAAEKPPLWAILRWGSIFFGFNLGGCEQGVNEILTAGLGWFLDRTQTFQRRVNLSFVPF